MTPKRALPIALVGPNISGVAVAVGLWGATIIMIVVFALGVLLSR